MGRSWPAKDKLLLGGLGPGVGRRCLLLGPSGAPATQPKPTQFWPWSNHIFAPLSRIDLNIVPVDRSRRDLSKYIPNLINLARNKNFPEDFMIFWENSSKISPTFSKNLENVENFRKILKISKKLKIFQVLKNVEKSYILKNGKYFHHRLGFWN